MIRPFGFLVAALLAATTLARAETTPLKPELAPLAFLVGSWTGSGNVADTGGTSHGTVTFAVEDGGAVLLRRDHTDLFDPAGKPAGSFEQLMMIYAENGKLRADYTDGEHVIHYTSVAVVPGRTAKFSGASVPNAPTFALTFDLSDARTLAIRFEMAPPGQTTFHPIATGSVRKSE